MFKYVYIVLGLFICFNANALKVEGIFKQGGLVAISYDVSITNKITVNGKPIKLENDGFEYYPVARSANKLIIKQELNNGTISQKTVKIEKQNFKVEHIKGVKKKHVTTSDPEHIKRIRSESALIKKSRISNDDKYFNTTLPEFIQPSQGRISGLFGSSRTYNGVEKSWHKGYDIANKQGTPIIAPLKGRVVLAMKDSFYNGNLVIIDHGRKIYTIYAHMYDMMVKQGEIVNSGDVIGLVGSTGRSTGPHLHWGAYVGQKAVNVELLLKK